MSGAECCLSLGSSLVTKVGEDVVLPFVCKNLGFIMCCKKYVNNLNNELIPKLENAERRLRVSVDQARRDVDVVHEDVETWLEKVGKITEEAKGLAQKLNGEDGADRGTKSKCGGIGFVPSLASRRRIGRDACNLAEEVGKLLSEVKDLESEKLVAYRPQRAGAPIENRGYEAFESRTKILNSVKDALRDDKASVIGVYGMPGMGKTMLVKEIRNEASKDGKLFTSVIFVAVSETPDVSRIQKEIATQLGMTVSNSESESEKALRLRERLGKEKFLVILDDVWKKLDLDDVGIPNLADGDLEGCKIMLTSRFGTVLNTMDATTIFLVERLPDSEAMHLFNKSAGERARRPDFQSIAADIVKECAGLPIALESLASTLRNQPLSIWKDALTRLQRSILTDNKDMNEKVYASIRLCYELLGDEDAQGLFLLCCLREEDANMSMFYTFIYGIGWGLFKNSYTLEEAVNRAHTLFEKLKAHCLLLEGDYDWSVKMHDVVRDVGMHIAAKDQRMYNINSNIELEKHLEQAVLKDSTAISLLYNDIVLPEKLECPLLRLIWLWKIGYRSTPDLFFQETKELRVLDLSYTYFNQLPSSFRALANLRTLVLCGSSLGDIKMIGELKNLEILEMEQSNIVQLPEEIGQLTRLRSLGLYKCSKLTSIPPNVISKLTKLEELNMLYTSNMQWEVEGSNERKNASLAELGDLKRLKALHIDVSSAKILSKGLFSEELERCEIVIDNEDLPCDWYGSKLSTNFLRGTKMLKLYLKNSCLVQEYDLGRFVGICNELQLFGLEGAKSLVSEISTSGFQQLKHLAFQHNSSIQYLAEYSSEENGIRCCGTNNSDFQCLESLRLWQINKLEQMINGELISPVSFANLREIEVKHCGNLRNLFPLSVAKNLQHLESINLKDCKMMDAIVNAHGGLSSCRVDKNDQQNSLLPRLNYMSLVDLPSIVSHFCSDPERTDLPFFSGQITMGIRTCLQNVTELYVWKCNCLRYLFSACVAVNLAQLGRLDIQQCNMMEEIVVTDVEDQKIEAIRFPQLHSLTLAYLPKLTTFCTTGISVEFPLLANLNTDGCPQFRLSAPTLLVQESS